MKNISKYKIELQILIPLGLFMIISVLSIYSAKELLPSYMDNIWIKQIIWYLIGGGIALLIMKIGNKFLYNNAWIFYIINILALLGLFFFGNYVNNAVCWYQIPGIGSIQPSEFMKGTLIITLGRMINDFNTQYSNPSVEKEFIFILKVLAVVAIPSILTFIEPDTGAVIIYLLITLAMLFIGGLRKRWFIILLSIAIICGGIFFLLFFFKEDIFINILGTNFFYRMDRIINWQNTSGMQLSNSMIAIGSGGLFGHGIFNTPLYFPELQTDFIFGVISSNVGFIGSISLIMLIVFFDISLISSANKTNDLSDKYVIGGIITMLVFQQIQSIGMTIGLLPIMGNALPFISYGGSSLLCYMILLGIIFNISNQSLRWTN